MERCELLARAKALAIKKGLDSQKVECPAIEVCEGTSCIFLEPDNFFNENPNGEIFPTNELELSRLREEIKRL